MGMTDGKSKKEEKKMTIVRDSREQKGCGWQFRASANCEGMEETKLDVGDYTIKGYEDKLMIERKTIGDLWNTLGRDWERFLREMERAKNHRMKYLIIEGNLNDINKGYIYSKVPPENIHAKLISLQVKHNVHVIFAGREDLAREYVRNLMAKLFRYGEEGLL
jgi:ERCC4-type nuclease